MLKTVLHHNHIIMVICCLAALCMSACANPSPLPVTPTASVTPPLPALLAQDNGTELLRQWVVVEREASIQGNLALLAAMWAEDGRIVDGRGSTELDDDYVWAGRAAILDRYTLAVFPAPPPPLTPDELANAILTVDGDSATLVNGGDRWRFTRRDDRWWLQELIYSAP